MAFNLAGLGGISHVMCVCVYVCMYVCPKIYIRRALNKVTDAPRSQTNKNVFNARLKRSVNKSTERK